MSVHKPVLLNEVIESLNLKSGDTVVDATFGSGGHSKGILKKIGNTGKLIGIDADEKAIQKNEIKNDNLILVNNNFSEIEKILENLKIEKVDTILADLGWSSDQLQGKGMSFLRDEKLDMRFSKGQKISALDVVNGYSEEELGEIFKELGEEKFSKSIASKIVETRKVKRIETTKELVEVVKSGVPRKFRFRKKNLATKIFQAIRIEVNKELTNLEKFISEAIENLKSGGRLAIISFHSIEDRIVKNNFRENARGCIFTDELTGRKIIKEPPKIKLINKKPIVPSKKEILENPRSRSAKLRICERI